MSKIEMKKLNDALNDTSEKLSITESELLILLELNKKSLTQNDYDKLAKIVLNNKKMKITKFVPYLELADINIFIENQNVGGRYIFSNDGDRYLSYEVSLLLIELFKFNQKKEIKTTKSESFYLTEHMYSFDLLCLIFNNNKIRDVLDNLNEKIIKVKNFIDEQDMRHVQISLKTQKIKDVTPNELLTVLKLLVNNKDVKIEEVEISEVESLIRAERLKCLVGDNNKKNNKKAKI